MHLPRLAAVASCFTILSGASGCVVVVYQPMSGLHRPAVVDPQLPNFDGLRLVIHCVPGGMLTPAEAGALCQKVGVLFENQGARVTTVATAEVSPEDLAEAVEADDAEPPPVDPRAPPGVDLWLELAARELHSGTDPLSVALCAASFTLVPAIEESTFAQDVVVRDSSGVALVSRSLEGRLVRRIGFGPWAGNKILDLLWRDDEEEVHGAAGRDLSTDLYQQLSQLVFDARMRSEVLRQIPSRVRAP